MDVGHHFQANLHENKKVREGTIYIFQIEYWCERLYLTAEIVTVTKEQKQKYPIDCQQPQKIAP